MQTKFTFLPRLLRQQRLSISKPTKGYGPLAPMENQGIFSPIKESIGNRKVVEASMGSTIQKFWTCRE
jgi:hypothetical protein